MFRRIGQAARSLGKRINTAAGWVNKGLQAFGKYVPQETQDLVVDRAVDVAGGPRIGYSPPVRQFLEGHEGEAIQSLVVRRAPIQSALHTALQAVTLGRWNAARAKAGYDKLFHLSLIANGRIIIEKNEVLRVAEDTSKPADAEYMPVQMNGGPILLNDLLSKAREGMGDADYFLYDAFGGRNCQNFVDSVLTYNNLLTPRLHEFIFQPMQELIADLPGYTPAVARAATTLGALFDVARHGT